MTTPARNGPTTVLVWNRTCQRALIWAMSDGSSTDAAAATRVGDSKPARPAAAALHAYSGHTADLAPAVAFRASAALHPAIASSTTSRTFRRSCASATAPPTNEQRTRGTSWARLARPTCRDERVKENNWNGTATVVSPEPMKDTISPKNK